MKNPENRVRLIITVILWIAYLFCMFLSLCGVNGWLPDLVGLFGFTGYSWARLAIPVYAVSMFTSYYMFPKIAAKDRAAKICWYLPLIVAILMTYVYMYLANVGAQGPAYTIFTIFMMVVLIASCTALMNKFRKFEDTDQGQSAGSSDRSGAQSGSGISKYANPGNKTYGNKKNGRK